MSPREHNRYDAAMSRTARDGEGPGNVLLVCEDGDELAAALEEAGLALVRASTVSGAIQACMEAFPDLAIVDVELARESGLAVLAFFRQLETARHLPVVLLSKVDDEPMRVAAFTQGCDDFLVRPVSMPELVARARRHLAVGRRFELLLDEQERLRGLATTDGLTGLANHRFFQERLGEEFRRAQRYDDPLSLIMLDVDHFKQVNDAHGHQVGDEVLKAMATCLRGAVRETDFVARYGGEEFAVVLPHTHLAGALTVAERMSADLRRGRYGPRQLALTASFGVSSFPGRAVSGPDQLVRAADDALLRAKREGRNKISLHQASLLPLEGVV